MLLSIVLVVFPFYRTTKMWLLICHLQSLLGNRLVSNLPAVVTTSNMFKFLFVIEFRGQAFLGDRVVIIFFLKIDYKSLTFNTFLGLRLCFLFVISNSIIVAGCQVRYIWNFGTINILNKINYWVVSNAFITIINLHVVWNSSEWHLNLRIGLKYTIVHFPAFGSNCLPLTRNSYLRYWQGYIIRLFATSTHPNYILLKIARLVQEGILCNEIDREFRIKCKLLRHSKRYYGYFKMFSRVWIMILEFIC